MELLCKRRIKKITTLNFTHIVLTENGDLFIFGSNHCGMVGNGTIEAQEQPFLSKSNVEDFETGGNHLVVLSKDSTVWSWGLNTQLQTGNANSQIQATPFQVNNLENIVQIAAGHEHSIALCKNGTVFTWGDNRFKQLGTESDSISHSPIQIRGLKNIIKIRSSSASDHSLALDIHGNVYGWGCNDRSQICYNSTQMMIPVKVNIFYKKIVDIGVCADSSYAVTETGQVFEWGSGCCVQKIQRDSIQEAMLSKKSRILNPISVGQCFYLDKNPPAKLSMSTLICQYFVEVEFLYAW